MERKSIFKSCIVPNCSNSVLTAPNKVFFMVPKGDIKRSLWCKAMNKKMVPPFSNLYCCEDHFDLEEDTENYIRYKIMTLHNDKHTFLRLKKTVLPHKFECQKKKPMEMRIPSIASRLDEIGEFTFNDIEIEKVDSPLQTNSDAAQPPKKAKKIIEKVDPSVFFDGVDEYYETALNPDGEVKEENDGIYKWHRRCIHLLLDALQKVGKKLLKGKIAKEHVWDAVADDLNNDGEYVSGLQCYAKMRSLKKTYKAIKEYNRRPWNDKKHWEFYEKMDEIFTKPVKRKSKKKQQQPEEEEPTTVNTKLACLLTENLSVRANQDANENTRHKERMEVQDQYLAILRKIAEKKIPEKRRKIKVVKRLTLKKILSTGSVLREDVPVIFLKK